MEKERKLCLSILLDTLILQFSEMCKKKESIGSDFKSNLKNSSSSSSAGELMTDTSLLLSIKLKIVGVAIYDINNIKRNPTANFIEQK